MERFTGVVSGAGLVGSALACGLGYHVPGSAWLLLDKQKISLPSMPLQSTHRDLRTSMLTPASIQFLQEMGVWQLVKEKWPIHRMHIWHSQSQGKLSFGETATPLGFMIENRSLQNALFERLLMLKENVHVRGETQIAAIDGRDSYASVNVNGNSLLAELVLAADGGQSTLRQMANLPVHQWQYPQHGLIATVKISEQFSNTAWQRFLTSGPLAILPIANEWASIVWSTTPEDATLLTECSQEHFISLLNKALHDTEESYREALLDLKFNKISNTMSRDENLPWITGMETSKRVAIPLMLLQAKSYISPAHCMALVGDAAHRIHPLAGQGLNLGLADCSTLIRLVQKHVHSGGGNFKDVLEDYNNERRAADALVLAACDLLQKSFSVRVHETDWQPLSLLWHQLLGTGMTLVNNITPLKQILSRIASGV